MSNSVDRRIVEMQFDNKDFENNVQTSVKSLDKLKKSLDLEESAKGLSAFEKTGRKFSLDGMVHAAEAVTSKFSIMGTIGDQMLRRIGDAAFNALNKMKRFVESLTIDPISTGLQEYETQINSIQTILSNTRDKMVKDGFSDSERLEIVNDRLDQLNHYADKTIYNFTEMTRNIGTFTAAGVELDTAVGSIQGIANIAAISGSTSEQASRAMYQLSQAISSGTVRLMDWNSVVNAGMGGEVFQKALQRTAEAMGVTVDKTVTEVDSSGKKVKKTVKRTVGELIDEAGSFRESLSDGWLSAEVLTATLEQFSWDFEQMAEDTVLDDATRESMIEKLANAYVGEDGDMEKARARARAMIGDISNLSVEAVKEIKKADLLASGYTMEEADEIIRLAEDATEAATKVKTFTQLFDTLKEAAQSGWTQTWEYIIGDFEEAKETLTGISDFFGQIIDSASDARNTIMKEWHDKGGRDMLWNNDEKKGPLGAFWNLVLGIQNVVSVIREEFQKIFPPATAQTLLSFTQKIQDATAKFKTWTENSEGMEKVRRIIAGIASAFGIVKDAVVYVWNGFKKLIGVSEPAAGGILEFAASIGDWLVKTREAIKNSEGFQSFLEKIGSVITSVRGVVVSAFKTVTSWIGKLWGKLKKSGFLTKIGQGISDFVGKIPDAIEKIKRFGKSIIDWVENSEALRTVWKNIKGFFEPVISGISNFGKKLWSAVNAFFGADTSGKESFWERVKIRFTAFGEKIAEWFKDIKPRLQAAWNGTKAWVANFFTTTIPNFFSSLRTKAVTKWPWLEKILAFFEKAWAKIKEVCAPVIDGIRTFFTPIWEWIKNLFSSDEKESDKNYVTFGEVVIRSVTETWSKIKAFFSNFFENTVPQWIETIKGIDWGKIIKIAFGVFTGFKLVKAISGIGKLGKGLAALGSGLKDAGGFLKNIAKNGLTITKVFKKKDSFATSLLKIAAAIGIMVASVVVLAEMEYDKAIKGIALLTALAAELLIVAGVAKKIDADGDSLLKLAGAVALLAIPVLALGNMPIGAALQGIAAVGILMGELAGAIKLASSTGEKGKVQFIALALAVGILSFSVDKLGNMPIDVALQGLASVGILMGELAGAIRLAGSTGENGKVQFIALALAVGILSFSVDKLGNMPIDVALQGLASVGILMGELAGAIKLAGSTGSSGKVQFMALTVAVGLLSFAVDKLGSMDTETALQGVLGVGAILLELSGAIALMKGATVNWSILIPLIPAAGIMAAVTYALIELQKSGVNWEQIVSFCGGFSVAIGAITGVTAAMSAIPVGAVAKGMAGLLIAAVGIGAAVVILETIVSSAITDFAEKIFGVGANISGYSKMVADMDTESINASITVIKDLAAMSVELVGYNYSGFESFSKAIIGIGGSMRLFGLLTSRLPEDSANYAKTMVEDVGTIATKMYELQQKNIDLTLIGAALTTLGSGIKLYATAVGDTDGLGYDSTKTVNPEALSTIFSSIGTLHIDEGIIATVSSYAKGGGNDLTSFALGLTAIGTAIQGYKDSITGINADDVANSENVLSMISDLQTKLPTEGNSIINWFTGKKQTLNDFAANIVILGAALNDFAGALTVDTASLSERGVAVIDSLVDIQNKMEKSGGLKAFFSGEKSLATLGSRMNTVGEGFKLYIESLSEFTGKEELTAKATGIIDSLADTQAKLGDSGGMKQWFTGEQSLGNFASNLKTFGENFKGFVTSINDVSIPDTMDTIVSISDSFADIMVKLNGIEVWVSLGDQIYEIGTSIKDFFSDDEGIQSVTIDNTKLDSIVAFINGMSDVAVKLSGFSKVYDLSDLIKWIGQDLKTFFKDTQNADPERLASLASSVDTFCTAAVSLAGIEATETGLSYVSNLVVGIQNGVLDIESAATGLSKVGSSAISTTYGLWVTAGANLAVGMTNGILSKVNSIASAAARVASAAIRATQRTLDEHSPSKVGIEIGQFFDIGIANGLDAYTKVVSDSATDMSQSVVDSASTMLRGANGSIFDNIDPNPTIRPVLDLSNIEAGLGRMNGMFGSGIPEVGLFQGMSFKKNVNGMGLDSSRITNGLSDRNIVNKLDELQKEITGLNSAVSNMKIVLDSGELVGATSSKMDNQLGTLAMRRGRGN